MEITCYRVSVGVVVKRYPDGTSCLNKHPAVVYRIVIYITQKIYVNPPYPLYQEVELSIVKCENPKLHNFCTGTPKGAGCVSGMEGRQCNNALKIALYCFKLLPNQIIIQKTCLQKNLAQQCASVAFIHDIISSFLTCSSFNEHTCFTVDITVGT